MIESILAGLAATGPLEGISVVLGIVYSILAVKRSRWCWLSGGISSAILVYLSWIAKLPMQACLQAYYVGMSVYGFWRWSKDVGDSRAVSTLPLTTHVGVWVGVLVVSAASSRFIAGETQAAWPFIDSFVTWGSLFATWLVAQVKLENWLYWIVLNALAVFLYAAQGLMFVALLMVVYFVVAVVGFITWFRTWRAHAQPS